MLNVSEKHLNMTTYYKDDFEVVKSDSDLYADDFEEYIQEEGITFSNLVKSRVFFHFEMGDFSILNQILNTNDVFTQTDELCDQSTQYHVEIKDQPTQSPVIQAWKRIDEKPAVDTQVTWPSDLSSKSYIIDSILSSRPLHSPKMYNDLYTLAPLFSRNCKSESIIYDKSVLGRCFSFSDTCIYKSNELIYESKASFISVDGLWILGNFYFLGCTRSNIIKIIQFKPFNKSCVLINQINLKSPLINIIKRNQNIYFIFLDGYGIVNESTILKNNIVLNYIDYVSTTVAATMDDLGELLTASIFNLVGTHHSKASTSINEIPIKHIFTSNMNNQVYIQTITGDLQLYKNQICKVKQRPLEITLWNSFHVIVTEDSIQLYDRGSRYLWQLQIENKIDFAQFIVVQVVHLGIVIAVKTKNRVEFKLVTLNKDHFNMNRDDYLKQESNKNSVIKSKDEKLRMERIDLGNKIELKTMLVTYDNNE